MDKNPLKIKTTGNGSFISFPMEPIFVGKSYACSKIEHFTTFEDGKERKACRYTLFDRINSDNEMILEVIEKNQNENDYRYFEVLDKVRFDWSIINMVGSSPYGYKNPKYDEELAYDKMDQEGEEFVEIHVYVDKDDIAEYEDGILSQDEYGDFFFVADRSAGVSREFVSENRDKEFIYTWMYNRKEDGSNLPVFLMVECENLELSKKEIDKLQEKADSQDEFDDLVFSETEELYNRKKPYIVFSEGRKLLRSDIVVE